MAKFQPGNRTIRFSIKKAPKDLDTQGPQTWRFPKYVSNKTLARLPAAVQENEPTLIPPKERLDTCDQPSLFREDQRPDPGDGRNQAYKKTKKADYFCHGILYPISCLCCTLLLPLFRW